MTKPSDERIERAARAICDTMYGSGAWDGIASQSYTDSQDTLAEFKVCAKAALEADDSHLAKENERLREVLEWVIEACQNQGPFEGVGYNTIAAKAKQALQNDEENNG